MYKKNLRVGRRVVLTNWLNTYGMQNGAQEYLTFYMRGQLVKTPDVKPDWTDPKSNFDRITVYTIMDISHYEFLRVVLLKNEADEYVETNIINLKIASTLNKLYKKVLEI